jgi:hypothetical protein
MAAVTCRRCCKGDSSAGNTERRPGKWERNLRGLKPKRNLDIMAGQRNPVDAGEGVSPGKEELLFLSAGHSQIHGLTPSPRLAGSDPEGELSNLFESPEELGI